MEFAFDGTETAAEWERWHGHNVEVTEGAIRVGRERTPAYVSPRPVVEDPPTPFTPVDVDVDECGDLYVLTAEAVIYRYDHRNETLQRLPCLWFPDGDSGDTDEWSENDPLALCVTEDSIYVADATVGGVVAFSKQLYQLRWIERFVGEDPFAHPFGLVGAGRTGYVLDGGKDEGDGFVAALTATGVGDERVVSGLTDPSDLAMGADGDLYVLDRLSNGSDGEGGSESSHVVRRFSPPKSDGREFVERLEDEIPVPFENARCIEVVIDRQVLVGVSPQTTGETTPYRYLPGTEPDGTGRFERITSFRQPCTVLLLRRQEAGGVGKGLYAIVGPSDGTESDGGGLFFLDEVTRNRLDPETGSYDARAWRRLDSGTPGVEWHRVESVQSLGEVGTQVRLNYHATDTRDVGDLVDDLGVDPAHAERLREAGITGAWGVLEHDPDLLAQLGSVPRAWVDEWVEQAWLVVDDVGDVSVQTLQGIGRTYADRLRDAGVTTVARLLRLDPQTIAEITEPRRGERDGQVWLRRARQLVDGAVDDWIRAVGLDPVSVAQLDEIGVDRLSNLLRRSPEWLARRLRVSADEAEVWVDRADSHVALEWSRHDPVSTLQNPDDALLDGAVGRYLWVELELVGSDVSSPQVDSFRAYFPRQSYLRYLPAIYREDERSAAFLERFLSVFESTFLGIEEDIEGITRYLDAAGVPEEYLSWLGWWLGVETDETWSESVTREFVARAPELFKKRGTPDGLLEALNVYLGDSVTMPAAWEAALERERERIGDLVEDGELTVEEGVAEVARTELSVSLLEYSDLDCIDVEAAREAFVAGLGCPQCFLVLVPPYLGDEAMGAVDRIVESGTPAHAVGRAVELQPRIQLAGASHPGNTYLGVNSALTEREFVLEESTLGTDSVLREREEFSQLDLKSRLGTDTVIS